MPLDSSDAALGCYLTTLQISMRGEEAKKKWYMNSTSLVFVHISDSYFIRKILRNS
jgi:hypothetical protein